MSRNQALLAHCDKCLSCGCEVMALRLNGFYVAVPCNLTASFPASMLCWRYKCTVLAVTPKPVSHPCFTLSS